MPLLFGQQILLLTALITSTVGCGALEQGGKSSAGAPIDMHYATSPAKYTVDTAITANKVVSEKSPLGFTISPTLPVGLSFSGLTGTITGTPTAITAEADYTIKANNSYGSAFTKLTLAIVDKVPTISYGGSKTLSYTVGTPIATITPTLGGGATVACISVPEIPQGLSLSAECALSGIPTAAALQTIYQITAINSGGSAALPLDITVIDLPPAFTYDSMTFSLQRGTAISSGSPVNTGGVITSCASDSPLPAGIGLGDDCTISGVPTALADSATYTITATNSGGTAGRSITLDVHDILPAISYSPASQTYIVKKAITALAVINSGGAIDTCVISPALPDGLTLGNDCGLTGTATAGSATTPYTVSATNTMGTATTTLTIAVNDVAPTITYNGGPYTYTHGTVIPTLTPLRGGGTSVACASSPALPAGLTLSPTCVLTGTPTVAIAKTRFNITATNTGGTGTAAIYITVNPIAPNLTFAGSPYTFPKAVAIVPLTPTNSGDDATSCISAPALPTGLSVTGTCVIYGTPAAVTPTATYTLTASNSAGQSTTSLGITITDTPPNISFSGSPFTFTHGLAITTVTPTNTGGAITSCTSAPALPTGLSVSGTTCAISGTPTVVTAIQAYKITATNAGGNSDATIQITVNDTPPLISYTGSPFSYVKSTLITPLNVINTGGTIVSCGASPALPAGLSLSATCDMTGTPTAVTPTGSYSITATNSGGSSTAAISITVTDIPPAFSYVGSPFTFTKNLAVGLPLTPTSTGGTIVSCAASPGLPAGLALSPLCVISGTPTAVAGTATYTITANNSGGSASTSIDMTVNDIAPTLAIAGSPFTYTNGSVIGTITPVLGGGAVTSCTSSPALPAGISINNTTCVISGTPTVVASVATYAITASNSGGSDSKNISITVKDVIPNIAYAGGPYTYINGTVITTLTPSNTGGAVTSCTTDVLLPTGLSLSTTCVITGTPTVVASVATYNITATNSGGSAAPVPISITVNDIAPNINYLPTNYSFSYTINVAISTLKPNNTGGAITTCTVAPALPHGLAIADPDCAITGTPDTLVPAANYIVTAHNSGGSSPQTIQIAILDVAPTISYAGSPFTYTKGSLIATLTPTLGGGPVTSCTSAPPLPLGLSINNTTCVISGTPTAVTPTANYTLTASNSGGSATASISITVNDAAPAFSYAGSPFTHTKDSAIATLTPTSTGGAITSCSSAPGLPAGLAVSTSCVVSGTPTAVTASATYTITATNSGGSASVPIVIAVNDIAPTMAALGGPFTYTKSSAIGAIIPTLGGGAVTSCTSAPALPTGLSINATTCVISGTPTAIASVTVYAITATNSGGSVSKNVTITVKDIVPNLTYVDAPFIFTNGTPISTQTPTNSGGAVISCVSDVVLPAGLTLSSTCVITGTPSVVAAAATYTITPTNSGGDGTPVAISITVKDTLPIISYAGAPFTFTKGSAITNKTPTNTGGAIVTCTDTTPLPAGLSISNACVISGTPAGALGTAIYTITATNSGGNATTNISITINDPAPAINYIPTSYNFTYTNGSAIVALTPNNTGGGITSCSTSPSLPTGLSIANGDCSITGTPTSVVNATNYTITATNSGGSSSEVITITVNDTAPAINYAASPFTFTNGSAIADKTPANTGGTITTCSVSPGLPTGLAISPLCVITGTPTAISATATYTVTANNSGGNASTTISITVNDVAPTISIVGSPFTYTVGSAIATITPTLGGGTLTSCASSPALPAGLSINNSTCVITGTPTTPSGVTTYTITATNSGGHPTAAVDMTVSNAKPNISYGGSPFTFERGTAISTQTPTNTGGVSTSCSSNPALPAGLTLSTTCAISGTPSVAASINTYTISATNAVGTGTFDISITINDLPPSIGYAPSSFTYTLRTTISTLTPSNTGGAIGLCAILPALPAGLSLSTTNCVITGTPSVTHADTLYTITATNPSGTATATIHIQIKNLPVVAFYGLTALNQAWNGSAPGSRNVWKATQDGIDLTAITSNTNGCLDSINPSWNATGSQLTFGSLRDLTGITDGTSTPSFNLWTSSGLGASPTHLQANTLSTSSYSSDDPPVFSPDGIYVAFSSKTAINGTDNGTASSSYNIFITKADGSVLPTALTQNTIFGFDSTSPVFSADGTMIFFASKTALDKSWNATAATAGKNIWRINTDGTGLVALTSDNNAMIDHIEPALSRDGNTLVWSSKAHILGINANSYNIWKMDIGGTNQAYLTSNTAPSFDSHNPKFAPDGSEIVFTSQMNISGNTSSSANVWVMSANGASPVALTQNLAGSKDCLMPQFSPDGTKIAFASLMDVGITPSSSYNIFVINSNGTGQPTAITQNTNGGYGSFLAPFGAWFAE
ncbi:putative Ig domain-containing protein [Bdellovibrionota bacterium FG-1]